MESESAILALAALAQPTRLETFRLLVRHEPEGLPAGEIADALAARRWLAEQLQIAQTTLEAQSERTRLAQLRYDAGSATYLEVLDAQRDLLAAEQQLVQARRAVLSSQVALYTTLGGGSAAPSSNQ